MKFGQITLIVITSIITFIGLALSKIYDIYVKKNIIVQSAIYLFFTLLVLRVLYWIAKPLLNFSFPFLKLCLSNIHITFTADPNIAISLVLLLFVFIVAGVVKSWLNQIK